MDTRSHRNTGTSTCDKPRDRRRGQMCIAETFVRMVDIAPPPAALIVSGYLGDTMALADTGVPTQTLTKPWRRKVLLRRVADLLEEHG